MNTNKENELVSWDDHIDSKYGTTGDPKRTTFETKAVTFALGEIIKEARKEAKMTREQLAQKAGVKKSTVKNIENGQGDIRLSVLYQLVETGLGKRVCLTIT